VCVCVCVCGVFVCVCVCVCVCVFFWGGSFKCQPVIFHSMWSAMHSNASASAGVQSSNDHPKDGELKGFLQCFHE
jgi:hypothetical protein